MSPPVGEPLLEVSHVVKRFGGLVAVDDASLTVRTGMVTGLVGPNGAGKTTLFNLITGDLAPDAGEVTYQGRSLLGLPPHRIASRGVGRTFQDLRLCGRMTVAENVLLYDVERIDRLSDLIPFRAGVAARRRVVAARTDRCIEFVGLGDKRATRVNDLSHAEQKLLSLARVLALEPKLLLLDEPASGLDRTSIAFLCRLVRDLAAEGRAVVIVEHNLDVIRAVSDIVAFLDEGRVLVTDVPEKVFADADLARLYMGVPLAS